MRTAWQNTVIKDGPTLWLHCKAKRGGCECQWTYCREPSLCLFLGSSAQIPLKLKMMGWSQSYERAWLRPLFRHLCSIFPNCESITTSCLLCLIWHMWCKCCLNFFFSASGATLDKCLTRLYWKSIGTANLTRQTTLIDIVADNQ